MPPRRQSFEARAGRRNKAIEARNQKIRDQNPLFEYAGMLEQVAELDTRQWDALSLAYDDLARGIAAYERAIASEGEHARRYMVYFEMLAEAIGLENAEEVEADYRERWRGHASMSQPEYRLNYLNNYLARYLGCTSGQVFEEARHRLYPSPSPATTWAEILAARQPPSEERKPPWP